MKSQKRSDTEFADIAELAISDLEDEVIQYLKGFHSLIVIHTNM